MHHRPRNSTSYRPSPPLPCDEIAALEVRCPSSHGLVMRSEDPTHGMPAEVEAELCAEKLFKADGLQLPGMLRRPAS